MDPAGSFPRYDIFLGEAKDNDDLSPPPSQSDGVQKLVKRQRDLQQ